MSILEIPHGTINPVLLHPPNNRLKGILNFLKGHIIGPGIIHNALLHLQPITEKLQRIHNVLVEPVLVIAEGHEPDGPALEAVGEDED